MYVPVPAFTEVARYTEVWEGFTLYTKTLGLLNFFFIR